MQYWQEFLTVALVHLLAVMSPGPDFVMITRSSLIYSRRTGKLAALGLGIGISVHVIYSLVGIGLLIAKSVLLFSIFKYLAAGYLIYLGVQATRSKPKEDNIEITETEQKDLSPLAALRMGILTNVFNPKATLFFLSLFTQVIKPGTPLGIQLLYGLEMCVATFVWFYLVAHVFSNNIFKQKFKKISHYIDRTMGTILIALGIKVALSTSK